LKVLEVDNSIEIRTLLQDILSSRNHNVELTESGEVLYKSMWRSNLMWLLLTLACQEGWVATIL